MHETRRSELCEVAYICVVSKTVADAEAGTWHWACKLLFSDPADVGSALHPIKQERLLNLPKSKVRIQSQKQIEKSVVIL